jgi:hypothetical protein
MRVAVGIEQTRLGGEQQPLTVHIDGTALEDDGN